MEKTSKIYVAGHRGMVGSAILRLLLSSGFNNIVTRTHSELDLTNQFEADNFFNAEKPEYVFLAAAKVGGILANDTHKAEFMYQNIMIAVNVIHASYKYGVKKLLNLGSSCIYPKFAQQPLKEEYLLTGQLEPTNEPYAIAKISALKLCRYYNEQYGSNFISVMPTNLYGPNDNYNLETSHVLPAFIRKFHLARLLRNKDFNSIRYDVDTCPLGFNLDSEVMLKDQRSITSAMSQLGITENYVVFWGGGEVYREFLHADDLADACIFIMLNYDYPAIGEFVNIGTGKDIKIKDLAALIKEIIGYEGEINHDLSKSDGTPKKLLDVSRIKSMGWEAKISLKKGIENSYNSYLSSIKRSVS